MGSKELDTIMIPLADVRAEIVQLMKDGVSELPLTTMINLLHEVYKEKQKTEK